MEELDKILLYAVAMPAGIAAVLLLRSPGRLAAALALPMVAYVLIRFGWTGEKVLYTIFAPLAGLAVGLMMAFAPRTIGVRVVLAIILGALVTLALWPIFNENDPLIVRLFPGAAAMLLLALLEPMAMPRMGAGQASFALGLAICAGAAGGIMLVGYKQPRITVPMISLGVALLIIAFGMWRRKELTMAAGPLAVIAASFATYPLVCWLYAGGMKGDVAPMAFAILTASPLLLWTGMPGMTGDVPRRRGAILRVASAMVACIAAAGFTYFEQREGAGSANDQPAQMSDADQLMHEMMMEQRGQSGGGSGGDGGDDSDAGSGDNE